MKKRSLPSLGAALSVSHDAPSVDEARDALGGRVGLALGTGEKVGVQVRFADARGDDVQGILIFATHESLDVWVGEGRFHRVPRARVRSFEDAPPTHALADVAADALVFSQLAEGAAIRFVDRGGVMQEGTLVEKCRYGALVENSARKVLALSFRRLWPV